MRWLIFNGIIQYASEEESFVSSCLFAGILLPLEYALQTLSALIHLHCSADNQNKL